MITFATPTTKAKYTIEQVNDRFMEMLPLITQIALQSFVSHNADAREEAVQSVIVGAFHGLKLMADKGKLHEAFATPLAHYAVARHCTGRPGGLPQNSKDITSSRCQYLKRARVVNFGFGERVTDTFVADATETDARYPVHKTVQIRLDFMAWFKQQSKRDQLIIRDLVIGETTADVARKFNLSAPMISCLRKKFANSWYEFIADKKEEPDFIDVLKALAEKESA